MNIFEKLSISQLVKIIGEDQLNSIQSILKILNNVGINENLIHSRTFLADYAKLVHGQQYINNRSNLQNLLDSLTKEEIKDLSLSLDAPYVDNRVDAINNILNASKSKKSLKVLAKHFDIHFYEEDTLNSSEKIDNFIIPKNEKPYKQLKDYQFEVMFKSLQRLENPYSRFILQMPTGSGKTRTAIEIISTFLNNNPEASVIWLAHSTELCDQAAACFLEVWPHLAKREILFKRHYGQFNVNSSGSERKIDFLCAGFQSTYADILKDGSSINSKLNSKRLIVVDEAHKAVAKTYQFSIKKLISEGSNVMGLTATPGRSYKALNSEDENKLLSDFFFDELISFESPSNMNAIEYLRTKGVLANADLEVLKTEASITFTSTELANISDAFEIPSDILVKLGKDTVRNAEIINKILDLINKDGFKSIIYFATSLEQSKLISSILSFLKIYAVHVDGDTPSSFREQSINAFRNQEIQVLCNYEVLATGFDAPLVDCVFIARPTASVVLYSQMIGRGLRGPAIGGKEECKVVNVRDNFLNLPSIEDMYKVFEVYWSI